MIVSVNLNTPVVLCSVPKCGTHFVMNIFSEIVGPENVFGLTGNARSAIMNETELNSIKTFENKVYGGHFWYSESLAEKLKKIPKIILIRDPRDYVLSQAHFWPNFFPAYHRLNNYFQKLSFADKVSATILGVQFTDGALQPVYETFLNYAIKWIDSKTILIKYEHLIRLTQDKINEKNRDTIGMILKFIGVDKSTVDIDDVLFKGSDPAKSLTFRTGKMGNWKNEFNSSHVKQIKVVAPKLISYLGYEDDEEWDLSRTNMFYESPISYLITTLPDKFESITEKYLELMNLPNSMEITHLIKSWTAMRFFESSDYENVLNIIDQLLEKDPTHAAWNYLKAFCIQMLDKEPHMSLSYYEKALENGYSPFWVYYNRGIVYSTIKEFKKAYNDLTNAIELDPEHVGAKYMLESIEKNIPKI